MLHYNPRHVSSINMPICSLLSSGILYSRLQTVTIPDAMIIQFVLLKIGMLMPGFFFSVVPSDKTMCPEVDSVSENE